jgi:hypothetical protein
VEPVAEITILALGARGNEITVLAVPDLIGVFGIHAIALLKGDLRNDILKFLELKEKVLQKIVIAAVFRRIPLVRIPAQLAINRKGRIRRIHGNDVFLAKVAGTLIERPLVSPGQPPLKPAIGTKGRRRNAYLFVKGEIVRFDDERLFTVLTTFCFGIH